MSGQGHGHEDGHGDGDDPRAKAHEIAHRGVNGALRVEVPDIDACLAGIGPGNSDLLDVLSGMQSAYTTADRLKLIDQLIKSLDAFYVHQPMKWAKHAVDPVRALMGLRRICEQMGDLEFHTAIARIFKSLRDIHTAYVLPEPYRSSVWFLPFTLAAYWERGDDTPRVVVDGTLRGFPVRSFRRGSEVLTWNGRDIEAAVRAIGYEESGSNRDAQFANGLRMMTIRWLGGSIVPECHWVTLGYLAPVDPHGGPRDYHEIRLSWRQLSRMKSDEEVPQWMIPLQAAMFLEEAVSPGPTQMAKQETSHHRPVALDRRGLLINSVSQALFTDDDLEEGVESVATDDAAYEIATVETALPGTFRAQHRALFQDDQRVEFGHLAIMNFMIDDTAAFVTEFKRLLTKLPQDLLLIDLRGNAGGNPHCAEEVMQFLTPEQISPLPFEFLATPGADVWLHGANPKADPDFGRWGGLVRNSVFNGFMFSPSRSLTSAESANSTGQTYTGKVGLLVDAITYSTGDIFAALFKDHGVGPIIGVSRVTGGGGADMIFHREIALRAPRSLGFSELPHGAQMHLAIRRYLRVGEASGMPVEEAGVPVDLCHLPTGDDFYNHDRDLMRVAVECTQKHTRSEEA